jgi:hypothetical protein
MPHLEVRASLSEGFARRDEAAARPVRVPPARLRALSVRGPAAKLPYAGINRIRFEGTVSTDWCRYPRFRAD